jgi:hypothetical protein
MQRPVGRAQPHGQRAARNRFVRILLTTTCHYVLARSLPHVGGGLASGLLPCIVGV